MYFMCHTIHQFKHTIWWLLVSPCHLWWASNLNFENTQSAFCGKRCSRGLRHTLGVGLAGTVCRTWVERRVTRPPCPRELTVLKIGTSPLISLRVGRKALCPFLGTVLAGEVASDCWCLVMWQWAKKLFREQGPRGPQREQGICQGS